MRVDRAAAGAIDLILLDVMLPGKDGFAVCRELRRSGNADADHPADRPVQEAEKIEGLDVGADDYSRSRSARSSSGRGSGRFSDTVRSGSARGVRLDRELRTAAEVQQRFFPQTRPLAATSRLRGVLPSSAFVGGDYFDYLDLPDDQLGLVVADVAGKGAPAALLMASLHACIRAHAPQHGRHCEEVAPSG